jgi:hypothetical protein
MKEGGKKKEGKEKNKTKLSPKEKVSIINASLKTN